MNAFWFPFLREIALFVPPLYHFYSLPPRNHEVSDKLCESYWVVFVKELNFFTFNEAPKN